MNTISQYIEWAHTHPADKRRAKTFINKLVREAFWCGFRSCERQCTGNVKFRLTQEQVNKRFEKEFGFKLVR